MQNDIRLRTKLVLKRGNHFLVGRDCFGKIKWSIDVYDAWTTRIMANAELLARYLGADIYLFNNITGDIKQLEVEKNVS